VVADREGGEHQGGVKGTSLCPNSEINNVIASEAKQSRVTRQFILMAEIASSRCALLAMTNSEPHSTLIFEARMLVPYCSYCRRKMAPYSWPHTMFG
jgi:hypothetical protein